MTTEHKELIPLAAPDIREEDIARVNEVLRSGMLVQGKKVKEAESLLSRSIGVPEVCLVSNGTASLHLALVALGIGQGDEVIVPAFSYVATANVVELIGATCVFADINLGTFNIDPTRIEELITPRTKAIMPVHEFGLCADMTKIMEVANRHGIPVVEDAACAIGATQGGRHAGTFGHFGSFSFHPRKSITSGEGGCLVTARPELSNRIQTLRNHGIAPEVVPMDFVEAGFNYRLTDFQAALLIGQLGRLQDALARKRKIASQYLSEIKIPGALLPSVPEGSEHSWQTFHVVLETEAERNALSAHLRRSGIMSSYGAQCIPAMTYYRTRYGDDLWRHFPQAYHAYTSGLAIPLYEKLSDEAADKVIHSINTYN
jgi:dTDP-4-amino-4,6-dideoxygalactose transaminase